MQHDSNRDKHNYTYVMTTTMGTFGMKDPVEARGDTGPADEHKEGRPSQLLQLRTHFITLLIFNIFTLYFDKIIYYT